MSSSAEVAIAILRVLSFIIWFSFTAWYGISRRWETNEYGINTFVTSLTVTAMTALLVMRLFVESDNPLLIFLQIPCYVTICVCGLHRAYLLKYGTTKDGSKRNGTRAEG